MLHTHFNEVRSGQQGWPHVYLCCGSSLTKCGLAGRVGHMCTVVSQKSTHGWSTFQRGGWTLCVQEVPEHVQGVPRVLHRTCTNWALV